VAEHPRVVWIEPRRPGRHAAQLQRVGDAQTPGLRDQRVEILFGGVQ